jgi:hypothetical protein
MLLLEDDVQQIVSLGFKEGSFAVESDGFKILRNSGAGGDVSSTMESSVQSIQIDPRDAGCIPSSSTKT